MNESFITLCQLCSLNTKSDTLNSENIHWQSVWDLALRHRVVPVIADRIKKLGISVPDDVARLMEKNVQENLFKGMSLAGELVHLTQLFQKNDIPFLAFKGIAMTKIMNQELHQRHHGDMDLLLIEFDDIKRADELLRSVGYQRKTLSKSLILNSKQSRYFFNHEKDIVYFHPQKRIVLELHFKLFLSKDALPISIQDIYLNRSEIQIGATTVPVVSKADHQLYLLVHGAFSPWARLKWLCDIPLISNKGDDYSSDDFLKKVKLLGLERIVTQGLCLTHELLKMPITDQIKQDQKNNINIINFAKKNLLLKEQYTFSLKEKIIFWASFVFWYLPSLRKDFSYKIDHFKSYRTRTSDWEILSLPSSLFWLYFPLRPFLWLKRQF